jgi:hypothetical protein
MYRNVRDINTPSNGVLNDAKCYQPVADRQGPGFP